MDIDIGIGGLESGSGVTRFPGLVFKASLIVCSVRDICEREEVSRHCATLLYSILRYTTLLQFVLQYTTLHCAIVQLVKCRARQRHQVCTLQHHKHCSAVLSVQCSTYSAVQYLQSNAVLPVQCNTYRAGQYLQCSSVLSVQCRLHCQRLQDLENRQYSPGSTQNIV